MINIKFIPNTIGRSNLLDNKTCTLLVDNVVLANDVFSEIPYAPKYGVDHRGHALYWYLFNLDREFCEDCLEDIRFENLSTIDINTIIKGFKYMFYPKEVIKIIKPK